jgi:hypothetical protein
MYFGKRIDRLLHIDDDSTGSRAASTPDRKMFAK